MTNMEITVSGITMAEGNSNEEAHQSPILRRPRTSEDFFLFCTYVLEYENYPAERVEETRNASNPSPPLDSSGSSVNSESTSSSGSSQDEEKPSAGEDSDASDSHNNVSCFCGKPFAGRPMIECSICFTWIHLSCAKIKKSNIPDVFHCATCKASNRKRRSASPSSNPPPEKSQMKRSKRTT